LNYGGHIYSTAFNVLGTADTAMAATHYFVETGSDGFVRPKTLANARTEIVTTASVNSAAATTVGTITSGVWNAGAVTSSSTISAGSQVLAPSGGLVGAPGFSWTGNTGAGIYRPATDTVAIVTNSTERVRVDASGNVGINTSSMIDKLCISSSGTNDYHGIRFYEAGSDYGGFLKYHNGDDRLTLGTTNAAVDINAINIARSTGNVGIGTTNPQATLHVNGTIYCANTIAQIRTSTSTSTFSTTQTTFQTTDFTVTNFACKFSNSTILITANVGQVTIQPINGVGAHGEIAIFRQDTGVQVGIHGVFSLREDAAGPFPQASTVPGYVSGAFTPGTTSPITYMLRFRHLSAGGISISRCVMVVTEIAN
jgi:hypothetical protein